jgi:hypothetical protein
MRLACRLAFRDGMSLPSRDCPRMMFNSEPRYAMEKYNDRLPVFSSKSMAIVFLACALSGCGKDAGRPMPPPGKPPRPQASLQLPSASIQNALFAVPSYSIRYQNGQVLIAAHRVIHT